MKALLKYIKYNIFQKATPKEHEHEWDFQYRTGNAADGKSEVYKCKSCPKWAVRHYGHTEKVILH